ncbi:MAG: exodeoxyribonuclease III [Gammaproteobacteria bacterium]|nr:exodeoxyribonuclease III [Gammaproteobacteria bacterium]
MRVITANLNGIRAAHRKGFFQWLARQRADVVCVQETKAQVHQLSREMLEPKGFYGYFHDAEKKGYSGVAIFSRQQPDNVRIGLDIPEWDKEGRYIQADFGGLSIASLYLPSGSSGDARQRAKYQFMDKLYPIMKAMIESDREFILCGDWNIVHQAIDIKNWKSNQKNSGCLPEERAWLSRLFDELGWVDVFRVLNQKPDQYTWWSNRGNARANNVGWRIDYQIATPGVAKKAAKERIYKGKWFSDHAPLIIDYP